MKRIISLMMIVTIIISSITLGNSEEVYAATETQDKGFSIDEELFNIQWTESKKLNVYQTVRSFDSSFDKGVKLGYVVVHIGFATSKKKIDGKYYQRILSKAEMVPQTVNKDKNKCGMSQFLKVEVTVDDDIMKNLTIEPTSTVGSTSYSVTGSKSTGGVIGVGIKGNELTLNGSSSYSLGMSATTSYTENALIISTNKNDNDMAVWNYDYVSSGTSKAQNAYLFGSSIQRGLLMWNMAKNGRYELIGGVEVRITATFGGGVLGTTTRVKSSGRSYHLGTASKTFEARALGY